MKRLLLSMGFALMSAAGHAQVTASVNLGDPGLHHDDHDHR
jgi:hypothetical protein